MAGNTVGAEFAKYWAIIRSTAMQRLTTAQTWEKIREWESQRGIQRPVGILQAVNTLRSLATQARVASERLAKAGPEAVIAAEHISPEINARPLDQQVIAPKYIARFKVTVMTPTGEGERWLSYVFHGQLPTTKGELERFLTLQAPAIGAGSDEIVTGYTGQLQLVAQ